MSKNLETQILEFWYGVDRIFFGKKEAKNVLESDKFKEYITTKAGMLSNVFEVCLRTNYEPEREMTTVNEIKAWSIKDVVAAKNAAKSIISESEFLEEVKSEIKEVLVTEGEDIDKEQISEYVLNKRFTTVALDCLMLEDVFENGCSACLDEWVTKVTLDSYRTIEMFLLIL